MRKFDVQIALEGVREAHQKWAIARAEFGSNLDFVMTRLLMEAAVNHMSVSDVAERAGMTPKQIRMLMRRAGLDPKTGKGLLAKTAAEALADNAALMGVEPHEMDLTSPLAYLPMGAEMKDRLIEARVHRVTELEHEHTSACAVDRPCPDDLGGFPETADLGWFEFADEHNLHRDDPNFREIFMAGFKAGRG